MFLGILRNHCTDVTSTVCSLLAKSSRISTALTQNLYVGSKGAGHKLLSMLEIGASKPWKEVMEVMTGEPKMDTSAFREYFKPLEEWLKEENKRTGVTIGWKTKDLDELCTP